MNGVVTETELRAVLAKRDVLPSRKLGQNFLVDENSARWIVDQLELGPEDVVVEVGPGVGALTEHVVGRVKRVILIEYDRRLAGYLDEKFGGEPGVEIYHQDAVGFDVRGLFAAGPVKLLGNLPYSAGGAILRTFLKAPTPVARAVLMLQKEMIERILAKPRTKAYGVLSLRMQAFWEGEAVKIVPPECFFPRPQIDSTVMKIRPRTEELPVFDYRLFDELVRRGFAQRRKKLVKNLPPELLAEDHLEAMGLSLDCRAEELSVDEWVDLTRRLDPLFVKDEGQRADERLAVVDENDEVVRAERRDVIHGEGLMHRAVHVFVLNKRDEVFLQKRSRLKDLCPGLWDSSAAGHVDEGEDYGTCAVREVEEELGLKGVVPQEMARLSAGEDTGWEFVRLFALRSDGPLRFPCGEVETGGWFSFELVSHWVGERPEDFAPGFLRCWGLWVDLVGEREG